MADWNPEREMRYQMHVRGIDPKCLGHEEEYIDYQRPPSAAQARAMCAGCPLFDLCDESVRLHPPSWGVWAGHIYGIYRKLPERA